METTEKTIEQITAEIIEEMITCARQCDKWRKPYAAIVGEDGSREFISSVGRFRTPLEAEDKTERATLRAKVEALPVGCRVETRNKYHCSHKHDYRDSWTRTEDGGWKHETIGGSNRYGYR